MANIMHWLLPKERRFFEMLSEQSNSVLELAKELKTFVDEYPKLEKGERKARVHSIKKIERDVYEIKQVIVSRLDKNYATPIDKEDILKMAELLGEIADLISTAASKFVVFGIERIEDYTIKLVDLVHQIVDELNKSVSEMKKLKSMEDRLARIFKLEDEADNLYDNALSDLFHYYKNSIDVIKYKEVYELVEASINKCRYAAEIIQSVITKHS